MTRPAITNRNDPSARRTRQKQRIAGIVLAAGRGQRFGGRKQLADFGGKPLLAHAINAAIGTPELDRVVVVVGAYADEIKEAVNPGRAQWIECRDWPSGLSASLRCGLRAIADATVAVVLLGDQPQITSPAISAVLDALGPDAIAARAVYGDKPGHPVAFRDELFDRLQRLEGDRGAQAVLNQAGVIAVDCSSLATPLDIDEPNDLGARS